MPSIPEPWLSKSRSMSGLQCPKLLWRLVHEPEAEELEPDPGQQYLFDRGHEVGRMAQFYVSGRVLIDVPHRQRQRRLQATAEAVRNAPGCSTRPPSSMTV